MYRKATVWKVTLKKNEGDTHVIHVMSPGASVYDLGDLSGMLREATKEFNVDPESDIVSIEKSCVAFGMTKLPDEGALALREDGTVVVNDPQRLAMMAGLDPSLSPLFDGTEKVAAEQRAADLGIDLRAVAGQPMAATAAAAQQLSAAVEYGAELYEKSVELDRKVASKKRR